LESSNLAALVNQITADKQDQPFGENNQIQSLDPKHYTKDWE
jgi:hypothetical protein